MKEVQINKREGLLCKWGGEVFLLANGGRPSGGEVEMKVVEGGEVEGEVEVMRWRNLGVK